MPKVRTGHAYRYFKKHPVTTYVLLIVVATLIIAVVAEQFLKYASPLPKERVPSLAYTRQYSKPYGTARSIRLREWNPNFATLITKGAAYIRQTDKLEIPKIGGWRFRTDKDGFIMPTKIHRAPDISVFFLGGSTTECITVPEHLRFPYLAGRFLERLSKRKVNAYNSGVSGNNSLHSINILYHKIIPLQPDIVVMMHVVNDIGTIMHTGTYWNNLDTRKTIISNVAVPAPPLTFASVSKDFFQLLLPQLTLRFEQVMASTTTSEIIDEWRDYRNKAIDLSVKRLETLLGKYEANLLTFIAICRSRGITPVLMTQANRYTSKPSQYVLKALKSIREQNSVPYADWLRAYNSFNDKVREVGKANNVLVIDLAKQIPQSKQYLYDTVHLNEAGSKLAADIIASALLTTLASTQ